ncbi:DUF6519 domain-containing protein [Kovacikia minuta CCNUW1]|uniref:DUF6519 domain-containing protein n=1 Tax=Kovacikia minuta TaxID=2931930 RepID=UPI001CCAE0FC|nr:DUF6519 domain-containing protein [Kovacikia minuta]UBF28582.1 DUF6519 domain-containing protein [Kovacikia minuta CCNUW1]
MRLFNPYPSSFILYPLLNPTPHTPHPTPHTPRTSPMKGDFTRFTFRPEKHYTGVLMQQGRLQLDSDWNEQVSIQTYLNQVRLRDTIGGAAGTPGGETKEGFKIVATPDQTDWIINPGSFYVGGVLCELKQGSDFSATYSPAPVDSDADTVTVNVPFLAIDGQPFAKDQWLKDQESGQLMQIREVSLPTQPPTLKLHPKPEKPPLKDIPPGGQTLSLRRVVTYKTQPDFPNPPLLPTDTAYLLYLDVWERHVTAIEDPEIREVALTDIPDTTTRTKTVWQVKCLALSPADDPKVGVGCVF